MRQTSRAGGTASKTQEMEIDGHARWGHDFKFEVDPKGNKPGLSGTWNGLPLSKEPNGEKRTTQRTRLFWRLIPRQ